MSKNDKEFYYGINNEDGTLVRGGVFERFPKLIPAVGENYWREDGRHKKMLLVGESNYFKKEMENQSVFLNPEEWYKGDTDKLIPESKVKAVSNWTGHNKFVDNLFNPALDVLRQAGINIISPHKALDEFCFYNYYLRPALDKGRNKSLDAVHLDSEVAGLALSEIIKRLELELVVFVSKKAYKDFCEYMTRHNISYNMPIEWVNHPAHEGWNKNDGAEGHQKFRDILNKYWINKL